MSLLQPLFLGKLDIIGDVHGELDALKKLIAVLGYDENGFHKENRKLVFVGDLVDRGPDSPGVVFFIKNIIENGNGQMVLGNHEINVLQHKAKSGSGWYFDKQIKKDSDYLPFKVVEKTEKAEIFDFLSKQPIALENEHLRIVHAAWVDEKINLAKNIPLGEIGNSYIEIEKNINKEIEFSGLLHNYHLEQDEWADELEDHTAELPFLKYTCEYQLKHQMNNPLRVLTSGVEVMANKMFFASGKWRFVQRQNWWDFYDSQKPVVIGHFWRKHNSELSSNDENVFKDIHDTSWHGKNNNVFCVDYSVGARFLERKNNKQPGSYGKLAALSFPEKVLTFEDGIKIKTLN